MPRKKQESPRIVTETERRKKAAWGGFIRCELDSDMRENFVRWATEYEPQLMSLLDLLVREGYVFSVRVDEENSAYVARLQITLGVKPKTYILTAFHASVPEATMLVLFKHVVLLDSDWSHALDDDSGKPGWG